ncbi:MAG: DUF4424 domain-containing protein [Elusimicrobium sp.]|nr:DUF4424 domain-containing protein [Elusimicrobium sp.]
MKRLIILLFALFLSGQITANDSFGEILPTGGINFKKQENVEMLQEALFLSSGKIEVNYLFRNTTDKDITAKVFFPMPDMACLGTYMGPRGLHNFKFTTWANGEEIAVKEHFNIFTQDTDITNKVSDLFPNYYTPPLLKKFIGRINTWPENIRSKILPAEQKENCESDNTDYNEFCALKCIVKAYLYWEQTFPANEVVHIKHTYEPGIEGWPFNYAYKYILKTGANWQGPIKQFNSLINYGVAVNGKEYPPEYNDFIVEDIKNFTPKEDLSITEGDLNAYVSKGFCTYKEGCTLYREKEYPLCLIFEDDNSLPEVDTLEDTGIYAKPDWDKKISEWMLTGYKMLGGYLKIEKELPTEHSDSHHEFAFAKSTKNERNLPLCRDFQNLPPQLYKIDGPANIRVVPNGKKIASWENGTYAWVTAEIGDWVEVIQGSTRGWTNKQNLINIWEKFDNQ